jgi:ABC-type phosphate transport system substrate-binding protein
MSAPARVWRGSVLAALSLLALPDSARAQLVVIVNRANPIQDLSSDDLRRIFLGARTSFAGGTRIELAELLPARDAFYKAAFDMRSDLVERQWMALVFRGEAQEMPKSFVRPEEVRRFVADHAGGIGFVDLGHVDGTVKVLTIDGRAPSDAQYRLRP